MRLASPTEKRRLGMKTVFIDEIEKELSKGLDPKVVRGPKFKKLAKKFVEEPASYEKGPCPLCPVCLEASDRVLKGLKEALGLV